MRDEFMITRQGKQFVLYAGLLDEAHTRGLESVETELLQVPGPDNGNVAIVKAIAKVDGKKFSGIGDASPDNVGRMIAPHAIRMAETRAKARALRDAINVGATSLEELGPEQEEKEEDHKAILREMLGKRVAEFEDRHGKIANMTDDVARTHYTRIIDAVEEAKRKREKGQQNG